MASCPNCKTVLSKPEKTWKYGARSGELNVEFFVCPKCGARFREYRKAGKLEYTLSYKDGHYRKI